MSGVQEWAAVIDSVRDYAIFILDRDGIVRTWNSGARAIKQYTAEEIIGRPVSIFYTPEDVAAKKPQKLLAIAARDGLAIDEGWRVRKDGSRFWADVVITRVNDENGALSSFVKVTRDLTERRRQEEELRRLEESLSATLYSIGDGVIATDDRGRVTRMNPVAESLTGWTQDDARGRPIEEVFRIINEVTMEKAENPIDRVLADGVVVGLANHTALVARDGALRPIADSGSPIVNSSGKTIGAVLVFRDVTEERRAEAALRLSEERLRLMIASVSDYAIYMLDPDGRIATWNPGAQRVKGYTQSEILGQHFSCFYAPEDVARGKPERELEAARRDGRYEVEAWRVRKDGTRFWANIVVSAIRNDEGELVGYAKVTRDMTERMRTEQELRRAELEAFEERLRTQRAEQAVRERDVFLSVAAHELRTPLTALQLKLQSVDLTIEQDLAGASNIDRARSKIRGALRQTDRLAGLVERLLDVSRIAAGRFEVSPEEADLGEIVREVLHDVQEQAKASGTEIRTSFDGDSRGKWDRHRLEQVVLNLVSNAVKYGQGRPIDVAVEGDGDLVRLVIEDHGIGIQAEDVSRIFGPFERAAPVRNFGGLGLGLYVTRYIVEAHHGEIHVDSTPGYGSKFIVTLPRTTLYP